jgi:hypothetical protein
VRSVKLPKTAGCGAGFHDRVNAVGNASNRRENVERQGLARVVRARLTATGSRLFGGRVAPKLR